jgi:hypothetical protein
MLRESLYHALGTGYHNREVAMTAHILRHGKRAAAWARGAPAAGSALRPWLNRALPARRRLVRPSVDRRALGRGREDRRLSHAVVVDGALVTRKGEPFVVRRASAAPSSNGCNGGSACRWCSMASIRKRAASSRRLKAYQGMRGRRPLPSGSTRSRERLARGGGCVRPLSERRRVIERAGRLDAQGHCPERRNAPSWKTRT